MFNHLAYSGFDSQMSFQILPSYFFLMKYLTFPLKTDTQSLEHEMDPPEASCFCQLSLVLYYLQNLEWFSPKVQFISSYGCHIFILVFINS